MAGVHEQLSEQFRAWEVRGRGWQVYDDPVSIEPPFRPFPGHYLPDVPVVDDGRRPTFLSSLVQGLSRKLNTVVPPPPIPEADEEPEPELLRRDSLRELHTSLPAKLDISSEALAQFLANVSRCREPVTFELLGVPHRVSVQFAAHPGDISQVRRQLQAHFPEATFQEREGVLEQNWDECLGEEALTVEFGLAREFMLPLASGKLDPFIGIIGALSELRENELGLLQVIFQPVANPWAENIVDSVTHGDGTPFFVNRPELAKAAEGKISSTLFAAVVRVAVKSESFDRTLDIARDLASSLSVFAHPQGNELIPLDNTNYPFEKHIADTLHRQSRRSGMVLNRDELIGFVHLPSSAVRSAVLDRESEKTKPAPASVRGSGLLLGNNTHAGESLPVCLTPDQRVRHTHVIGVHGTGKSTLLFNLIRQDIDDGEGVAVLDPHGDLIDQILGVIPRQRIDDVVLVDPSDPEFSVGFNILSAHSDLEKNLLASDLISVFRRLSTSWGDQMNSVLQNAILAFLESDRGGTLADLRRFLLEPAFREEILKTVKDSEIVYYWRKGFTQLSGNKSIGPVITRLNEFLAPKPIRHMVSQKVNRLDFGQILDTGKIFLAKLSQGQMGRENSFLLGSLIVSKFQQLAMSRQAQQISQRRDFWLYVDEFSQFITPSMTEILTGARKYRLGLILAHQELRQLERDREVASAVLSNPYTRVVFRVGDDDARKLAEGFAFFEARDLQNLETGQAICRVEKAANDFNLTVPFPEAVDPSVAEATRKSVIAASRAKYATPRAEVEAMLMAGLASAIALPETPRPTPASPPVPKVAEQKAAEVPKGTVSEKEKDTVSPVEAAPQPEEPKAVIREPEPPRDLGRGGAQHKAIQERLQAEAHALGFMAEVEKQLNPASKEAADVLLRRGELSIAVEISVTTTTDHEFRNVQKCLGAGFARVAVVSPSSERLKQIEIAVQAGLGPGASGKVSYHTPDGFIAFLKSLAVEKPPKLAQPPPPEERITHGYKVKRKSAALSPEEQQAREAAAVRLLSEAMKRKV